jgi:hypothetical protein
MFDLVIARQFKIIRDATILKTRRDKTLRDGFEMAEIRCVATVPAAPFHGLPSTI